MINSKMYEYVWANTSYRESLPDERIWLIRTDAMRAVFCLFNNYDEAADMVSVFMLIASGTDRWILIDFQATFWNFGYSKGNSNNSEYFNYKNILSYIHIHKYI